jgi:hypothetical protein
MQTYGHAGGGSTFGQVLLRWGFTLLGFGALWLAIDRLGDWSTEFAQTFEADLNLWLQGIGLFALAGILFGIAAWLPVPGRGGRPSAVLSLGIPLLLLNAGYAVLFHIDFADLPDFLQSRMLVHPLLSFTAVSVAAILFGAALVSGFCPAGYAPLARLRAQPQYDPGAYAPPPQAAVPPPAPAAPAPPPPPPAAGGAGSRSPDPTKRPDNQATRELPPRDRY